MPNTFGGFEVVAQTKNFIITCANDAGARERAQFISYTCEADLTRLEGIFSTNFQVGQTHDHGVWVNVLTPDPAGATNGFNYGFEREQSSRIVVLNAWDPPPPAPSLFPADPQLSGYDINKIHQDFARRIFVVELAEILMDFTGYGWDEGGSNGEGLSQIVGALFYPDAYYGSGQGPRVNQWLNGVSAAGGAPAQAPRIDWVSRTEDTDRNIVSYGCAILFVNYLVNQLGFRLEQVVRAGGDNLAQTFARLTGKPEAQAFADFSALIAKHAPVGTGTFAGNDNIFPLRDIPQRVLITNKGYPSTINTVRDPLPSSFKVKPGLFCPEAKYDYFVDREFAEVSEYVRAVGYLNAGFNWSINGAPLPTRNLWDNVTVGVAFATKQPDGTVAAGAAATQLRYIIVDSWNKSALFIKNTSTFGDCTLNVSIVSRELGLPAEPLTNLNDTLDVDIVTFVPGEQLRKDRKKCDPFFAAIDDSIVGLSNTLSYLKNRPDPPDERIFVRVIDAVQNVQRVLAQASESTGISQTQMLRELKIPGALVPLEARASETIMARIKSAVEQETEYPATGSKRSETE